MTSPTGVGKWLASQLRCLSELAARDKLNDWRIKIASIAPRTIELRKTIVTRIVPQMESCIAGNDLDS